jgi:exopolyphosphatase/guanosine-5'-triphosphate,3'-diphosphate pyrophosphatase
MEPEPNGTPPDRPLSVAALDLGSNSFHMVIARSEGGNLQILDRLREPVRLAAGLDADGRLTDASQEKALACLRKFGERIRGIPRDHVRAVGTNTLRRARNGMAFRSRAGEALGRPVEVISGQEEARLIYLGVSHNHPSAAERRLVVDIGGGSTEVIVGERFEALSGHSLFMGCVTYSRTYFPGGVVTRDSFRLAETAAGLELRAIERQLRERGWETAIGASGTINAVGEILRQQGWTSGEITLPAMKKLRKTLVRARRIKDVALLGLRASRAPVLPGGLAILIGAFKSLGIDSMTSSSGALREGVLYDLLGRIRHEDVRDRTIRRMVDLYHADTDQASRVQQTVLALFDQLLPGWEIDESYARQMLTWAARLHEIGLAISYTGFHKHGAYLVANSHMPGFATDDQLLLAALIRGQRRKLALPVLSDLPGTAPENALRMCVIFRLAALLNRSRVAETTPRVSATPDWNTLTLELPEDWPRRHPLILADLEQERRYLSAAGIDLVLRDSSTEAAGTT